MITSSVYNPFRETNEKFYNILNYALIKKDLEAVKKILSKVNDYTKDPDLQTRITNLFIGTQKCEDWFGISEVINQTTVNMVFSGNVNIKINGDKEASALVDDFIYDSNFIEALKEAYACALSCSGDAVAYVLMRTQTEVNLNTLEKIGDNFVEFEVLKSYEVRKDKNKYIREFYKTFDIWDGEKETKEEFKFVYTYEILNKNKTTLTIKGYKEKEEISSSEVRKLLNIDIVDEVFDFVPIFELKLGRGQLPNAIYIESRLAENLYFKYKDIQNSQTRKYVPEQMLYENSRPQKDYAPLIDDPYTLTHPLRTSVDRSGIVFQQGYSAIEELEKHLKLDILEACLDAKISPISLGFSLLDSLANNTDDAVSKERVSIRLRETHVAILKVFIARIIKTFLKISGFDNIDVTSIAVIFDQYITPSIETLTNVLAKQVQFGIKSIEQAVSDLNKNEMSDEEIEKEVERIREQRVQFDYNMTQRNQNEKEVNKEVEEISGKVDNKENNVLKSSGVVE